jgi:hypothetical protein
MAGVAILVVALLSTLLAFLYIRDSARPAAIYTTVLHSVPIITATIGTIIGRGNIMANLAGGVVGVLIGIVGTVGLVSRLNGSQ